MMIYFLLGLGIGLVVGTFLIEEVEGNE